MDLYRKEGRREEQVGVPCPCVVDVQLATRGSAPPLASCDWVGPGDVTQTRHAQRNACLVGPIVCVGGDRRLSDRTSSRIRVWQEGEGAHEFIVHMVWWKQFVCMVVQTVSEGVRNVCWSR